MKKFFTTAAILALLLTGTVAFGQVLETENFDGLELGILNENVEGIVQGQGGYQVYAPYYGEMTNPGPGNFQVVERNGADRMLRIEGCDWGSDIGGQPRRVNKLDLKNNWPNRTPGNDILKLSYEFFTGEPTTAHHRQCVGVITFDIDLSVVIIRIVEIEYDNREKMIWGVAWHENGMKSLGNHGVSLGDGGPCYLPENTWVTVDMYWNSATGEVRWVSDYFDVSIQGAMTDAQLTDYGLIGMISVDSEPNNDAAEYHYFDNWTISALKEVSIDESSNHKSTSRKNLAFNVANNTLDIDKMVAVKAINIYGMDGRLLINKTNPGNTIDLSMINQGIYIMHVETDRGIYKEKFIK